MKNLNLKKIFKIIISIFLVFLVLVGGYYLYQLFLVPQTTKLPTPTVSYPQYSVVYKLAITQVKGTTATVGDKTIPLAQVTNEVDKDMKAIKEAGFEGIKINFFQNKNALYLVNRIALHAAQHGLYPIAVLQGNPSRQKGQAFTLEEMKQWLEFVKEQVSKNKNIIYFWEIWNEPGLELFKYGTPEEFVELLKATYPVIKKENPQAKVIVTLGAEGKDTSFEDKVLALGGGDYFDILSFHPYGANPYLQEDLVKEAIAHEKALVTKYNNRWPLVIGEIGQPVSEVSEEEQARLAEFLYSEAAKNNLPVTWYYWSDERLPKDYKGIGDGFNWGLIRYDGTKRPVYDVIIKFLQPIKKEDSIKKEITKEKTIIDLSDYNIIKQSHFGGGGNESTDFATMKELGIHWLRVRVTQNPNKNFDGQYPIALEMRENPKVIPIDDYVKKAQENGLLLYMVIDPGGPPWSAKKFANFVKAIVERYDKDGVDDMPGLIYPIKHYEILNEVEISPYVKQNFTFETIMEYIRETYRALKDACPDAKLANPSFVSSPGIIDNIISNGGDKYFDIFTYHSYDEYLEVDSILSYLEKKGFGPKSSHSKPIFITESSFSPVGTENISQEEIAQKLVRSYVYALAKGVSILIPSEFKEMPYFRRQLALSCFVDKDGNKRPSFYAYKTLISKLDFFTSVKELTPNQYKFIVNNKPVLK
jgi:arabinogalactan endo-1,4-beta-galactosidase